MPSGSAAKFALILGSPRPIPRAVDAEAVSEPRLENDAELSASQPLHTFDEPAAPALAGAAVRLSAASTPATSSTILFIPSPFVVS